VYGRGEVFDGIGIRQVLLRKKIGPDFEYAGGEDIWLDYIHRATPEADIYFVINRHGHAVTSDCSFRIASTAPQIWDPVNGRIRAKVNYRRVGGRVIVPLKFEAFQSWFIVFPRGERLEAAEAGENFPAQQTVQELTGAWDVAFDVQWGGPARVVFDRLRDWSTHEDVSIRYYSGRAVYTKAFEYTASGGGRTLLDLGVVKNIARVAVNGLDLGIVWTAPWQIDITPALKAGKNQLKIEVINLWPNRLIGDAGQPPEKRLTHTNISFKKDAPLESSGLLGPVTLKRELL
jgi:hypothetical protein